MSAIRPIRSRGNPLLARLRRLRRDPGSYRRGAGLWLEGEHLCAAWVERHGAAPLAVIRASASSPGPALDLAMLAHEAVELPDAWMDELSGLESPARVAYLVQEPPGSTIDPLAATLVLDRLQDPGNAGTLLRTAASFGVRQVLALAGTVALWSPKVLRAGMGAQFGLGIVEGVGEEELADLRVPLVAAVAHGGRPLWEHELPWPCAWVLGHEGQGVAPGLERRCSALVSIPQPGGEESLNVASAGAICLYESARQRLGVHR